MRVCVNFTLAFSALEAMLRAFCWRFGRWMPFTHFPKKVTVVIAGALTTISGLGSSIENQFLYDIDRGRVKRPSRDRYRKKKTDVPQF